MPKDLGVGYRYFIEVPGLTDAVGVAAAGKLAPSAQRGY
jgi:hypothetical protein